MEDQFGGRTDDDLFYDDFEPVEGGPTVVAVSDSIHAEPDPEVVALQLLAHTIPQQPPPHPPPKPEIVVQQPPKPAPRGGLAFSRFADKPLEKPKAKTEPEAQTQTLTQTTGAAPVAAPAPAPVKSQLEPQPKPKTQQRPKPKQKQSPPKQPSPNPAPTKTPATRKGKKDAAATAVAAGDATTTEPGQHAAPSTDTRSRSGANPRQKLTDAELSAKLEKMKLLSAEKARKFEKAEKDQKQHEEAYARGMEEARKQKAENAERRRQNEEQRRKLEEERNKNRERKLKAMSLKEGGWDEGKAADAEEESRRPFRGSNGGIRGSKSSGIGASRFARNEADKPDGDRSSGDGSRRGGRGRGRGGNGRGRGGGRGGLDSPHRGESPAARPAPTKDDFPSLPAGEKKDIAEASPKPVITTPFTMPLPPLSNLKWDDEMEEFDELNNKGAAS